MVGNAASLGLSFTALPVLVLFWLIYGTATQWIVVARGRRAGVALGIWLAWALAASTPLFAALS